MIVKLLQLWFHVRVPTLRYFWKVIGGNYFRNQSCVLASGHISCSLFCKNSSFSTHIVIFLVPAEDSFRYDSAGWGMKPRCNFWACLLVCLLVRQCNFYACFFMPVWVVSGPGSLGSCECSYCRLGKWFSVSFLLLAQQVFVFRVVVWYVMVWFAT